MTITLKKAKQILKDNPQLVKFMTKPNLKKNGKTIPANGRGNIKPRYGNTPRDNRNGNISRTK